MRILVLQHLKVEHPGSFREFWAERGHALTAVELDAGEPIPDLEPFDLMAVMGGPMDVWEEDAHPWLVAEKRTIRTWVAQMKRPYLGICLGHQLLADALGGRCGKLAAPEVGLSRVSLTAEGRADPLLAGLGDPIDVFQWHGVEVAELPAGAVALASSPRCAVQAMRWGRVAYGVQFHPEIVEETVSDWERIPDYRASLRTALGEKAAAELAGLVTPLLPRFREGARKLDANLAGVLDAARPTL